MQRLFYFTRFIELNLFLLQIDVHVIVIAQKIDPVHVVKLQYCEMAYCK
jgi:hypothetical protein